MLASLSPCSQLVTFPISNLRCVQFQSGDQKESGQWKLLPRHLPILLLKKVSLLQLQWYAVGVFIVSCSPPICLIIDKVHDYVTTVINLFPPHSYTCLLVWYCWSGCGTGCCVYDDCWSHYLLLLQEKQSCDYEGWCRWKQLCMV